MILPKLFILYPDIHMFLIMLEYENTQKESSFIIQSSRYFYTTIDSRREILFYFYIFEPNPHLFFCEMRGFTNTLFISDHDWRVNVNMLYDNYLKAREDHYHYSRSYWSLPERISLKLNAFIDFLTGADIDDVNGKKYLLKSQIHYLNEFTTYRDIRNIYIFETDLAFRKRKF